MRKLRIFLCSTLVLLLMTAAFPGAAFAEDTFKDNADFIQGYKAEENTLQVYCAEIADAVPEAESLSVTLDGSVIPVSDVESTENEAVTYYCLVDVSGSIEDWQLRSVKKTLQAICDGLKDGDKMVIASMGDSLSTSGYLTDSAAITEKIKAIKRTNEDTNLYRALTDSLQSLDASSDATFRKCLVICSDGGDYSNAKVGRTKQEAERMIADTRIPVYCIFTPNGSREVGKEFGSLARGSFGGEDYYFSDNKMNEQQIGEAIVTDMHDDFVLTLDLAGFEPTKDELLLAVKMTMDGSVYGDTMPVFKSNLNLVVPEPAEEPEPEEEPTLEEGSKVAPLWLMITIPCVLLAAAVAVYASLRRKKQERLKKEEEERRRFEQSKKMQGEFTTDYTSGLYPTTPKKTLRFTTVGNKSFSIDIQLEEGRETTVGRSEKANVVLNKDDKRLSGVHFAVLYKGNALRVWDVGSTNGTYVNDIPLKGNSIEMHDGDILSAGSYRYRVQFVEGEHGM